MIRFRSFFLALALLTRIPLPARFLSGDINEQDYKEQDYGQSVLWYPVIGFIIAIALVGVSIALPEHFPNLLNAILIVCVWVALTGALHLDGLCDCVDAYYAAHRDRDRALEVLKDPHIGPMAVVAIVLVILLKVGLLVALLSSNDSFKLALIIALVAPRFLVAYYMLSTPYVRNEGIASKLKVNDWSSWVYLITVIFVGGVALTSSLLVTAVLLLSLGGWLLWWRRLWYKVIGGYTGDCLGGLIEVAELISLFVAAIFFP